MAFLDDFGRKISNLGQTAVQKTKGVTYGARINNAIAEEERNLNNIFRDLGNAYMQLHANDPEPQLENIVRAAADTEKRLASLYQQRQAAQGVVRCPQCGKMIKKDSAFCTQCGFPFNQGKVKSQDA